MVASRDNDCHFRACAVYGKEGIGKHSLGGSRRHSGVIDVATDHESVRFVLSYVILHLQQHVLLLICAAVVVQHMAQMPVASMEDTKHDNI